MYSLCLATNTKVGESEFLPELCALSTGNADGTETKHLLRELGYSVSLVNHVDTQSTKAWASMRGLGRMKTHSVEVHVCVGRSGPQGVTLNLVPLRPSSTKVPPTPCATERHNDRERVTQKEKEMQARKNTKQNKNNNLSPLCCIVFPRVSHLHTVHLRQCVQRFRNNSSPWVITWVVGLSGRLTDMRCCESFLKLVWAPAAVLQSFPSWPVSSAMRSMAKLKRRWEKFGRPCVSA